MKTGKVHSILSFGALDGPGVRTVVFLQGCPNRCQFCHNVDVAVIKGGKEYTVKELVDEIMKNKEYWKQYSELDNSVGGGVTFTGGEPLYQSDFLLETVQELKKLGVHVVIDSSAFADFPEIEKLHSLVDLWMISVKHMDNAVHEKLVGNPNDGILKNIKDLDNLYSQLGKEKMIRIRFVIIPGVTDSEEHLKQLGEYIKGIKNLQVVELLPYSTIGKDKWYEIFGEYHLEGVREANQDDVNRVKEILKPYVTQFK